MLVDADLVRTKLAKVCEDMTCACCWTEDAQVAAETIADAIRQTDLTDCRVESPTWDEVGALHGQVESLSAQVAELKKDAERYQWLRDECTPAMNPAHTWILESPGEEWDAAIDAAMKS